MNKEYEDWKEQIYLEAVEEINDKIGLDPTETIYRYFSKNYDVAELRVIFDWEYKNRKEPINNENDKKFALCFADKMSYFIAKSEYQIY